MNRFIWQYIFGIALIIHACVSYNAWWLDNCEMVANIIRAVGVLCLFIGIIGRIYATIFIGGMKNEGINGKFIDYGAYSLCRNPLYFFSFIAFLGLLALKGQITLIALGAVFFLITYHYTILGEERFLSEKFGDTYKAFLAKTARFFPRFSAFNCPDEVIVKPAFLHKELKRAINWILGALGFIALELLHYYDILPNVYFVY